MSGSTTKHKAQRSPRLFQDKVFFDGLLLWGLKTDRIYWIFHGVLKNQDSPFPLPVSSFQDLTSGWKLVTVGSSFWWFAPHGVQRLTGYTEFFMFFWENPDSPFPYLLPSLFSLSSLLFLPSLLSLSLYPPPYMLQGEVLFDGLLLRGLEADRRCWIFHAVLKNQDSFFPLPPPGLAYRYRPIWNIGRYSPYRQNRYIGIGNHSYWYISADMQYRYVWILIKARISADISVMSNQYRHIGHR